MGGYRVYKPEEKGVDLRPAGAEMQIRDKECMWHEVLHRMARQGRTSSTAQGVKATLNQ